MDITDKQLVKAIQSGNPDEENWATHQIYLNPIAKKKIIQYVTKNGGSEEEVKDVLMDTLFRCIQQIKNGKFNWTSTISTYHVAIGINVWRSYSRKYKKNTLELPKEYNNQVEESIESTILSRERTELIEKAIKELDTKCQSVLKSYYYEDHSMKEVAENLDFITNHKMAKKKVDSCRKKLRKLFLKYPNLLKTLNIKVKNDGRAI